MVPSPVAPLHAPAATPNRPGSPPGAARHAAALAALAVLPLDVPATPSAEEARRAAEGELAKAAYHENGGLVHTILRWLLDHLDPARLVPGVPTWTAYVVTALLGALIVIGLLLLLRGARLGRVRRGRDAALFEDARDASALAASAEAAARRGDWATAVVERFRAIIRSLDERGLVEDYPGLTAHEAGSLAGAVVPVLDTDLTAAAALFDAVRYGERVATREQDEWIRALADRVAAEPAVPAAPAAAGGHAERDGGRR